MKPQYEWANAKLVDNDLIFDKEDGFQRALEDGFFFLESPGLDLAAGDRFANSFYLQNDSAETDEYKSYTSFTADVIGKRQGYFDRSVDQVEQFFLESRYWDKYFPIGVKLQAEQMQQVAISIIRSVLSRLEIPHYLWEKATGKVLTNGGAYHLTFNHFRHGLRKRGLNVHKDSGWITMLRSIEPGLEVARQGEWVPINPRPNTFIMNFGCAIEILTRNCKYPVAAVEHRVIEQTERSHCSLDRFSYGLFADSSLESSPEDGLYVFNPPDELVYQYKFDEFLDRIVSETYMPEGKGLY